MSDLCWTLYEQEWCLRSRERIRKNSIVLVNQRKMRILERLTKIRGYFIYRVLQ